MHSRLQGTTQNVGGKSMREGWEYKKLGEVCNVYAGQGAPQGDSNYSDVGTPFIKAGNLSELISGIQESEFQKVSQEVASAHKLKLYKKGSVLFAKSGMSCMKNYIYTLKSDCYVVSHLAILEPYNIESKYLQYYLEYKKPNSLVKDESYPSIALKDIQNMPIVFPQDKSQEQSIVSELDKINELISLKKEQLKDYDNLAQSIFYDMFGDPVTNEKGWEVKKLGKICEITSAKRVFIDEVVDTGVPFIRGTELTALSKLARGEKIDYKLFITQEHYERLKAITGVPKVGDLLIPSINSDGIVWIVDTDEPLYFKDGRVLWVHVNFDFFTSETLQVIMHYLIENIFSLMNGATFSELKLFVLRDLLVPLPPLPLQQAFAKRIEAIEKQKQLISSEIKDLETLLASRMQYWFD